MANPARILGIAVTAATLLLTAAIFYVLLT